VKRASSEVAPGRTAPSAAPPTGGRIIAAEALRGVCVFTLEELNAQQRAPRPLRPRDLDTEIGRAAYAMGRRRGYDEGHAKGHAQGWAQGSQAFEDFKSRAASETAAQMQALLDAFRQELVRLESQVAGDLVSLAVDIARETLRRELSVDAGALLPAAAEALRAVAEGAGRVELRVHPADAQALRRHLEALPSAPAWTLHEDPAVHRGGCRIEADTGIADARFETRWQAVMARLGRDDEPLP
jgi:flagellar assembly protein FliH